MRRARFGGNRRSREGFADVSILSQLYFWLFPPGPGGSFDDLIFWFVLPIFSILMRHD